MMIDLPKNHRFKDLTGQKFNRLKVISFSHQKSKKSFWNCVCDCGNNRIIRSDGLTTNHARSCGCLNKEKAAKHVVAMNTTHGLSGSRIYNIYLKMLSRCNKQADPAYSEYGGRGIDVCNRWLSFENFLEDMRASYEKHARKFGPRNTSIERIDNNKGYDPVNCRWATIQEQNFNRRTNHLVTYKGQTLPITKMALEHNVSPALVQNRVKKAGWSIERAIEEPKRGMT